MLQEGHSGFGKSASKAIPGIHRSLRAVYFNLTIREASVLIGNVNNKALKCPGDERDHSAATTADVKPQPQQLNCCQTALLSLLCSVWMFRCKQVLRRSVAVLASGQEELANYQLACFLVLYQQIMKRLTTS